MENAVMVKSREKVSMGNDIIQDAYALINVFNGHERQLTQLHVQKLMFLLEAYYMNVFDKPLYDYDYQAWDFGPVVPELYNAFKKYGRSEIELTEEERNFEKGITEERKELMEKLYDVFYDFTAAQLVNFTHAKGSPWKKAWDKQHYSIIPKEDIKNWFSQYVKE